MVNFVPVDYDPFVVSTEPSVPANMQLAQNYRPLDITSQSQKADIQRNANRWPEGTSPEVRRTFDELLKAGTITLDIYNKAMRDPRQFQAD